MTFIISLLLFFFN